MGAGVTKSWLRTSKFHWWSLGWEFHPREVFSQNAPYLRLREYCRNLPRNVLGGKFMTCSRLLVGERHHPFGCFLGFFRNPDYIDYRESICPLFPMLTRNHQPFLPADHFWDGIHKGVDSSILTTCARLKVSNSPRNGSGDFYFYFFGAAFLHSAKRTRQKVKLPSIIKMYGPWRGFRWRVWWTMTNSSRIVFACKTNTLPETNIAPENHWLEDEISFWNSPFSGDVWVAWRLNHHFFSFPNEGEIKSWQAHHTVFGEEGHWWLLTMGWAWYTYKMGPKSPVISIGWNNSTYFGVK